MRRDVKNKKIYNFLCNDFSKPRWLKAAKGNAAVLFRKQKYLLSAAFYILAGKIEDAL